MSGTIVVVGYGPGVSTAVAERFAKAGYAVGLVGRNADKLSGGVRALEETGARAAAFTADAGDPTAVRAAVAAARETLGPLSVLHWNASSGPQVDLLTTDPAVLAGLFSVPVIGLVAAVQEALPDLKAAGDGAVLITNGAYGEASAQMDAYATKIKAAGSALGNAAKLKLVGLLSERLKAEGVFVGEVTIAGAIAGTPFDNGTQSIPAAEVAERFWQLFEARGDTRSRVTAVRAR